MSVLTLVHVTAGTLVLLVLLVGAAVFGRRASPHPAAWVVTCGLVCIVTLGASATALTLQAWSPAPARSSGESARTLEPARTFEPARDSARERRDVSRPASGRACLRVL